MYIRFPKIKTLYKINVISKPLKMFLNQVFDVKGIVFIWPSIVIIYHYIVDVSCIFDSSDKLLLPFRGSIPERAPHFYI